MRKLAVFLLAGVVAACSSSDTSNVGTGKKTGIKISVSPAAAKVETGAKQTFTATVEGAADKTVTWAVAETGGGSIDAEGTYTAPEETGSFTVIATSNADKTKKAEAKVTVVSEDAISVSIAPATKSLQVGQTATFTATVEGTEDTAVTWNVDEAGGGTVTKGGAYTAPGIAGVFHVKATSVADSTKSAKATVTVKLAPSSISVVVTPASASTYVGGTIDLTAEVTGANGNKVTWAVLESAGGSVSASGTYTAPMTPGVYHVVAMSEDDPNALDSATITVTSANYAVSVSPTYASVETGGSVSFDATVNGPANGNPVDWSVVQANGGRIGGGGQYTAPITPGTYTVVATSKDNPLQKAQASVTVIAANPSISITALGMARALTGETLEIEVSVTGSEWSGWNVLLSPAADSGALSQKYGSGTDTLTYTAPVTPGTYSIVARTANKPIKTATLVVTVVGTKRYCPVNTRQVRWTFEGAENPDGLDYGESLESSKDWVSAVTLVHYSSATTHMGLHLISEFLSKPIEFDYYAKNVTQVSHFGAAGPDGFMGTGDDVMYSRVILNYFRPTDGNTGYLKDYAYMTSGPDNKLGTTDDEVSHGAYLVWSGGRVDMIVKYANFGHAGTTVAQTEIQEVIKYDWGLYDWWFCEFWYCWLNGYAYRGEKFIGPGVDGVWDLDPTHWNGSSDDVYGGVQRRHYSSDSSATMPWIFAETDPTGQWIDYKRRDRSGDAHYGWSYDFKFTGNNRTRTEFQSYYGWDYSYTTLGIPTNWPYYIALHDGGEYFAQGHQRVCP